MQRVSIVGTSGTGKSTFAASLAAILNASHIELDALHWEPNWTEVPDSVLRERVAAAVARQAWVVDGNYAQTRDLVWPRADTVIWLDYSLTVALWRTIWRTLRRIVFRESCCNGNRESLGRTLSRDSIVLWIVQTYNQRRREFTKLLPEFQARGGTAIILRTPREARRWLANLQRATPRSLDFGEQP